MENMDSYTYLLDLALILISTKLLGLLTRRVKMPQVVGALLAGLILGPACLGILKETEFIHQVSEIGYIANFNLLNLCQHTLFNLRPDACRNKCTGSCGALLSLILVGCSCQSCYQTRYVCGIVSKDEVLSTSLANQTRICFVFLDVLAY